MHRVILIGSPRTDGRCASLARELFEACVEECPEDGLSVISVASVDVAPCTGCGACTEAQEPVAATDGDEVDEPLEPAPSIRRSDAARHLCAIDDDMAEVRRHLDAADELIVVTPVYFACVPAQLKALLDRLQPYYCSDARTFEKRPATVHVVGEGGDPHGHGPLLGTLRSALSCAGFHIERELDWVGKITVEGEIVADAEETLFDEEAAS